MNRNAVVSACLLMLATCALAAEPWPEAFRIQCGDIRHKQPYDAADIRGTLLPMFTGDAERMAASELAGYYAQGFGYKVTIALKDEQLTGTPETLSVPFTCQTRDPIGTGFDNKMTCQSTLRALATVPGFNMITASLSVPGQAIQPGSGVQNTVSIRRMVRGDTPGTSMFTYYQTVREMSCVYTR